MQSILSLLQIVGKMRMPSVRFLIFVALLLSVEAAEKCPTNFVPSDVVPGNVSYNYTHGPLAERIARLQAELAELVQTSRPEAYSVAVIHRNTTILTAGSVDTPFRVGSVTKIFVAMGALVLRERGALSLDDPVKKFLPNFSIINPYDNHQTTLRELTSHLSGFARDFCTDLETCSALTEEKALEGIAKMELAVEPWSSTLPIYSNLGFAVLGHAWEKATSPRQSWSDYLKDHVFTPLGMHNTGVDFARVKLAPGSVYDTYPSNYSLGWYGPEGDMYSTALDLAKFLKFMLKPNPELLSASVVREWTRDTTRLPDSSSPMPYGFDPGFAFAMPWEIFSITPTGWNFSTPIVAKTGGLGSYVTLIAFHPATELGVAAIVSDSKHDPGQFQVTNSTLHAEAVIKILAELIPEVSAVNTKLISSLYSGTYVCDRTDPVLSQNIGIGLNKTLQVIGGSVKVTATTPDNGLIATVNISLLVDGVEQPQLWPSPFSSTLVLKKNRDNPNTFWASPGLDCFSNVNLLSSILDVRRPNYPGSFGLYEVQFDPTVGLLGWPSLGAVCRKK